MSSASYSFGKTLLKIDNVCLEYDGRPVLSGVTAEVRDIIVPGRVQGQVVGILGPSGCGKTTLFRIIAGLHAPTSGQVSVNGFNRPVRAGEVGVVAQSYPLFEHRSVLGNLMLGAKRKEKDSKVAHDKVMALLEEFGLEDKYNLYPAQLSGGQRQRCAIIQQILCSEHFLLMDEPFSGLDLIMLEKTADLISKVSDMDDLNTIIVVTHDVAAACTVADHLWLMGRSADAQGNVLPGSRIVKQYNLIDQGLAWQPNVTTTALFNDFVREVKDEFRRL
ncbi:MAG: ATP-binding cassette domain-containing protein [Terracidiphilus sp.]|jgi:polar amino acid transport system ATP-binding protein/sulfate transport system ATP-binding protein